MKYKSKARPCIGGPLNRETVRWPFRGYAISHGHLMADGWTAIYKFVEASDREILEGTSDGAWHFVEYELYIPGLPVREECISIRLLSEYTASPLPPEAPRP